MIKLRATINGADVLILGLERVNLDRLADNQPIVFPASQIGITEIDKVILIGGETRAELIQDLRAIGVLR